MERSDLTPVTDAYGAKAVHYIDLLGSVEQASPRDRAVMSEWAASVSGPVLDAGSGPGHWSGYLAGLGIEVEGVDATPEFVAHASRTVPGVPFRHGDLRDLELPAGSLGGVLAWFSLIHLAPEEVPGVLRRFAAALRPGGRALLGFFTGPELLPFDHRVVTAWAWPRALMTEAVEQAGLRVLWSDERRQPNGRITAELVAQRPLLPAPS